MSEQDKLLGDSDPPPPPYGNPPTYQPPPYTGGPSHPQPPPSYYPNQQAQRAPATSTVVLTHHRPVVRVSLPPPPDYMALAICATIFCFPLGIIAIMLSKKVQENIQAGDIAEAHRNAYSVRVVSRLAYGFGALIIVAVILGIVLPLTVDDCDDCSP